MTKASDIARFASFSAPISAATTQIKGFTAHIGVLPTVSGTAAFQIVGLSSNAAHAMAFGQLSTTYRQWNHEAPSNESNKRSSFVKTMERSFRVGAAASVALNPLARGMKRLLATSAGRAVISALTELGEALAEWTGVIGAVAAVRAIAVGSRAAEASSGGVMAISQLLATAAAMTPFIWGISFASLSQGPIWRRLRALDASLGGAMALLVKRINSAISAIIGDIGSIEHNLVSAGGDDLYYSANLHASLVHGKAIARSWRVLFASDSTAHSTLATLIALGSSDNSPGFQSRLMALRKADAMATLAAPVLAGPVRPAAPSPRRGVEAMYAPSITINSTPTLVINSNRPADIEHRVLEALSQHRDALYEQWHREVQRRQRTDF